MPKKQVEYRHSETALVAAMYRAIAHKEHGDETYGGDSLAENFLPPHFRFLIRFKGIRAKVRKKSDTLTPGVYEYVLARTAFFDGVYARALEEGTPQIVLLGAGYDTRAYRLQSKDHNLRIFELDVPTTQGRKITCLRKRGKEIPDNVKLVPINFDKDSIEEILEKAGFNKNLKTLFMWEGVSMYLKPESVGATLAFVSGLLNRESSIAFDYAIEVSQDDMDDHFGAREFVETWKKHRSNEMFEFSIDENRINSFLEETGLKLNNHMDSSEIHKKFLQDDSGSIMGQVSGIFRFATASPDTSLPQ
jgi:methyltransferase (TIGR00027 family)